MLDYIDQTDVTPAEVDIVLVHLADAAALPQVARQLGHSRAG